MSLANKAEKEIINSSKLKRFVTPCYDGLSITNIIHSIRQGFGLTAKSPLSPEFFDQSLFKGIRNVVLLCVDGFGYDQLRKARFLRGLDSIPVTSVMPSTTVTSLSTLATGLTPQEHGLLGFRLYLRELGQITNMLRFGPSQGFGSFAEEGIDPEIFFPFPTIYQQLRRKGIKSSVINKFEYVDSPFSQMIYRGGDSIPYVNLPDLFLTAEKLLKKPGKKFLFLYWEMVDIVAHLYGTQSEEFSRELKLLDTQIQEFLQRVKGNTIFLLTSDHGIINTKPRGVVDIGRERRLVENLNPPPGGEARLRYLYCKRGKKEKVEDYFNDHFSRKALLMDSNSLLEKGFFGTGKLFEETKRRVGDFTLIPKKNYAFSYPFFDNRESIGKHGGLSKEEMLVPLVWKRS